ncbi:MAG: hypothetical protein RRZ69_05760 [Clostridia bacterium]
MLWFGLIVTPGFPLAFGSTSAEQPANAKTLVETINTALTKAAYLASFLRENAERAPPARRVKHFLAKAKKVFNCETKQRNRFSILQITLDIIPQHLL